APTGPTQSGPTTSGRRGSPRKDASASAVYSAEARSSSAPASRAYAGPPPAAGSGGEDASADVLGAVRGANRGKGIPTCAYLLLISARLLGTTLWQTWPFRSLSSAGGAVHVPCS